MIPVRAYLALLSSNLDGLGRRVAALVAALLGALALALVNPQLLRSVIDGALAGESGSSLVPLAALFVVVALAHQVVSVVSTWLAEDVGWRATNRLRADLTAHVLGLDMGFHGHHSPGHLIERVDGDVTALSNFFSAMVVKVVGNGLLILGIIVLVARESWLLGLVVGGLVVTALVGFGRLHGVAVPWWTAVSATQAEMYGQVGEQVEVGVSLAEIVQSGGESHLPVGVDDAAQVPAIAHVLDFGNFEDQAFGGPPHASGDVQRGLDAGFGGVDGIGQEVDRQIALHVQPAGQLDGLDATGLIEAVEQAVGYLGEHPVGRFVTGATDQGLVGDDLLPGDIDDGLKGHAESEGQGVVATLAVMVGARAMGHAYLHVLVFRPLHDAWRAMGVGRVGRRLR